MAVAKSECQIVMPSKDVRFCRGMASLLVLFALPLQAEIASEELISYMRQLEGMQSDFVQNIYANGVIVESSKGSIALAKRKLRWQVDAPFAQVIIVSSERIEIYDEDLAQLTIRKTAAGQTASPASMLMNPDRMLFMGYRVTQTVRADIKVFRLVPKGSSELFKSLEIAFAEGRLDSLQILDWQGQRTQIRFSNVLVDHNLPPALFELTVPMGTDVIRG